MKVVTAIDDGPVRSIIINNPPVNATSFEVRRLLSELLQDAETRPETRAIVVACAGKTFVAGADIKEFGKPPVEPHLSEVIAAIERCTKPVVAAIQGTALGGGLELAMGCHYRVAHDKASLGLPETTLGVIPGAGGIPRLSRLIGIPFALEIATSGKKISAQEALVAGLIDEICSGDIHEAANSYARRLLERGLGARPTCDLALQQPDDHFFDELRARLRKSHRGQNAPLVCVDIAESSLGMSLAEAVAYGRKKFQELVTSDQAAALRHAFFAERIATRPQGIPQPEKKVNRVGVVGAGTMGTGIAICFLNASIPVTLIDSEYSVLEKSHKTICDGFERDVSRGRMKQEDALSRLKNLTLSRSYVDLGLCDLVVEAVFEDMAVKRDVIAKIESCVGGQVIIASNTSYLNIDVLAEQMMRPQNIVGMHFFSPAQIMKLLENVRGEQSSLQALAVIQDLGRRIDKIPVMVKVSDGFVGNRMLSRRARECFFLLEEGALPEQIDDVLCDFGFPIGQFQLNDLAGLDVAWRNRQNRLSTLSPRERENNILDEIVGLGRLGQKNGSGFYRYDEFRNRLVDPFIKDLIINNSISRGIKRKKVSDKEILERCLYSMINEGARILEEGVAGRPEEIDTIWLNGYGFPRYKGGPMFYADREGLRYIVERMDFYAYQHGHEYWSVSPFLRRLADNNSGFYSS